MMRTFTIHEVSNRFGLPASTLRYYEAVGILTGVGRTASGQRIYTDGHINRLRTVCCFKKTGMTIAQLRRFFGYEEDEAAHIDEILSLLEEQQRSVLRQMEELEADYAHVSKKLLYYTAVRDAAGTGAPRPQWKDYRDAEVDSRKPGMML